MGKWTAKKAEGIQRLRKMISDVEKLESRIGWFESSIYPDGTPVAYIAAIQEFTDRSFMRTTADEQRSKWKETMRKGVGTVARGERDVRALLDLMGLMVEGDIRLKITQIEAPPLHESTIRARAKRAEMPVEDVSVKPLEDSGYMLATLTSATVEKSQR